MSTKSIASFLVTLLAFNITAFSESTYVSPDVSTSSSSSLNSSGIVLGDTLNVGSELVTIHLYNTCFKTNLRSVANPLEKDSKLLMYFSSGNNEYRLTYPTSSAIVDPYSTTPILNENVDYVVTFESKSNNVWSSSTTGEAKGVGNLVEVKFTSISIPTGATGASDPLFTNIKFMQIKPTGYESDGVTPEYKNDTDRPVKANIQIAQTESDNSIEILADFPGAEGFCGGFYSPLMVFFNNKRPSFKNISSFPLNPVGFDTIWPESHHPGYLLVLDKNNDHKITSRDELFSENKNFKNGFDSLKVWDKNKDGLINSKDPVYSKLQLWKDKNGNGKSEPSELLSLKDKNILNIYLNYSNKKLDYISNRAQARERTVFTFIKNSKVIPGEIIDYWFKPIHKTQTKLSKK